MLDIAKTLSTSAGVHALTGSSRPGAPAVMQPFGVATAPATATRDDIVPHDSTSYDAATDLASRRATAHPDAKVIFLAERVAALAPVSLRAAARRAKRADAVDARLPPLSPAPQPENRTKIDNQSIEGWYIATFSYPTTPDEAHAAAMKVWNAEVAEGKRIEAALQARHRIPQWEALERRTDRRLIRRAWRLTYMRPKTQDGLKAKAAAAVAVMQTGASDVWAAELHASVSRDALRIIGAEADARAEQDRQADGELLALGRLWEESRERDDRAHLRLVEAEDRYHAPSTPGALFFDPEKDPPVLRAHSMEHMPSGGRWYGSSSTIRSLRRPWPYEFSQARRDEIIAAYDSWAAADATEREHAGIPEARAEVDASMSENAALRSAICRLPARTPAGIDLKVRVILWLHDGLDTLTKEVADLDDPEFSASMALSLAADLARGGIGTAAPVVPLVDRLASAA